MNNRLTLPFPKPAGANRPDSQQRLMSRNKSTKKALRSVVPNGEKLRALRQRAGLTQEELAGRIGYSDRLIRKAEMGKRVDLRTIRALFQYFVNLDQPVEMSEMVIAEQPIADQILPTKWFEYCCDQQGLTTAVSLLSENCVIWIDGVSIRPDRMLCLMNSLIGKYSKLEIGIDYQASRGAWNVLSWKSKRQFNRADAEGGIALMTTICGITSFRVKHQQIIEIREFTDNSLYCRNYHQLLLSNG